MPTHFVAVWLLQDVLHERLTRPDWRVEDLDALVLAGLAPPDPTALDAGGDAASEAGPGNRSKSDRSSARPLAFSSGSGRDPLPRR
jgi:hypothetical protein